MEPIRGELSSHGSEIKGTWSQQPLAFKRTAAAAAEPEKKQEAPAPSPFGAPMDVRVPAAPIPFLGAGGHSQLIYELHITNFSRTEQNLTRIEVLSDSGTPAVFEGQQLITT
jgi:hypothetical protein